MQKLKSPTMAQHSTLSFTIPLVILSALLLTPTTSSSDEHEPILIHMLRPLTASGGRYAGKQVNCRSWQLGVEAHNVIDWKTIPSDCEGYMGHYMLGKQYRRDSALVVDQAIEYAAGVKLSGNGKDAFVFDIDETTLSNLPYYADHGFGVELYNDTNFNLWVMKGTAPALPESVRLYKTLLSLGIKIVFLTGRREPQRKVTSQNLINAGFTTWEKLILKDSSYKGNAIAYKSSERQKLVNAGYRVIGNIGDQWSDLLGEPEGERTFKLPDPMYFIG